LRRGLIGQLLYGRAAIDIRFGHRAFGARIYENGCGLVSVGTADEVVGVVVFRELDKFAYVGDRGFD
jgi:hypothetical protein